MTTFSEWQRGDGRESAEDYSIPQDAREFQGERAGFATRFTAGFFAADFFAGFAPFFATTFRPLAVKSSLLLASLRFSPRSSVCRPTRATPSSSSGSCSMAL